jgi:cytochrome c peroxidase
MHDGTLGTLRDVIDYYDSGGNRNPDLDAELRPLRLTGAEKAALISFLESLNSN